MGKQRAGFGFEDVIRQARALAEKPYQEPKELIPSFLKNINYDQLRDIRYKKSSALWAREKGYFKVEFFHQGYLFQRKVKINVVGLNGPLEFPFSPDLFDYGKNIFKDRIPAGLGFAGFRIHCPYNTPKYSDEFAVFLGASYFRGIGKKQAYGLSARGLAIDTALDSGEEFPYFKEFWIVKPGKGEKTIVVYAILDSPSLSGAYQFVIRPGKQTVMRVTLKLFFRKAVTKLGIAPATGMFLYGENSQHNTHDDFRPEVHDCDGLLICGNNGEWLWRPLINPKNLFVNSFQGDHPRGFGLFQRDLDFDHYLDLEARLDIRPSLWIVPEADFGGGHVELVQIPSDKDINDNIVCYWVPAKKINAGDFMEFSYVLNWLSAKDFHPPMANVTGVRYMILEKENIIKIFIDFQGAELLELEEGALTPDLSISKGFAISDCRVERNGVTRGFRIVFKINRENKKSFKDFVVTEPAIELRAALKKGDHFVSETLSFAIEPQAA